MAPATCNCFNPLSYVNSVKEKKKNQILIGKNSPSLSLPPFPVSPRGVSTHSRSIVGFTSWRNTFRLAAAQPSSTMMQMQVVICLALVALVGADECPDGGRCEAGHTCCNDPANGYECCPLDQAECCGDHVHCCPAGTLCHAPTSSCLNTTGSVPWVERSPAEQPGLSKAFRMIKSTAGEEDDNICPDQSRCPAEFSCLRALTKFGCCPLAQGVPCSDGKHCCPEGHECSADCRSCIKPETVITVLCKDGKSECPDGTTCCEDSEGQWDCCPLPKAVCCNDKTHCCPEGTTCDVKHSKCISPLTQRVFPMWAKFPARRRADWENPNECEQVSAVSPTEEEKPSVTTPAADHMFPTNLDVHVACDASVGCAGNTTCSTTPEGGWSCCPLPEAVDCEDLVHCCPKGRKCNPVTQTCDSEGCFVPWVQKVPTIPRPQVGNVSCDATHQCPDNCTCCKTATEDWACCPLPEAVCCDDHEHCCPSGTTCDLPTLQCIGAVGSTPMEPKTPAFVTAGPLTESRATSPKDEEATKAPEEEEVVQCDAHTSCPRSNTCCFMAESQRWGCCPLPEAVCCSDGNHCCPTDYKCDVKKTTCTKGEVAIPWYNKLPATASVEADPASVQCDEQSQCPGETTCCRLLSGEWGCCPLSDAVCCPDKVHCCPQGYTCNMASNSCQKLLMLQLQAVPLTRVYLLTPEPTLSPSNQGDLVCDEQSSCPDGETCCRTSLTTWGCCPAPNAVCCSDMQHCCPEGHSCTETGGCTENNGPHWHKWQVFFGNKKRSLIN
ncbi:granulin a [Spinachia spinachia]